MIALKRFLGTFFIIAGLVAIGCSLAVLYKSINSTAGLFVWISAMVAYCFGYAMRLIDEAKLWPRYPTEEEVRNMARNYRKEEKISWPEVVR